MSYRLIAAAVACLCALSTARAADEPAPAPSWTGHVDLVSRYVLRGITTTYGPGPALGNAGADAPESEKAALQWGADWSHPSGFYAGYFGSMVNYSYERLGQSYADRSILDFQSNKSIDRGCRYRGRESRARTALPARPCRRHASTCPPAGSTACSIL